MKNNQPSPPDKEWEDKLKILINDWMYRMIKFDEIRQPKKWGWTVYECPDLIPFIRQLLSTTVREAVEKEREHIFNLADGLVLEPENLKKQIEDFEKLLLSLSKEGKGKEVK